LVSDEPWCIATSNDITAIDRIYGLWLIGDEPEILPDRLPQENEQWDALQRKNWADTRKLC